MYTSLAQVYERASVPLITHHSTNWLGTTSVLQNQKAKKKTIESWVCHWIVPFFTHHGAVLYMVWYMEYSFSIVEPLPRSMVINPSKESWEIRAYLCCYCTGSTVTIFGNVVHYPLQWHPICNDHTFVGRAAQLIVDPNPVFWGTQTSACSTARAWSRVDNHGTAMLGADIKWPLC